jgi:uncharacterized protein YbjT (DUF2867 family)
MILVAGSTGSLGGKIVTGLLDRGTPVRALARATADTSALRAAGADVVIGDLRDPASLAAACQGVDAVITTASATRRTDDTIENVDLQGNLNLFGAAQAAGVQHIVMVSTTGAAPDNPVPVFRAKGLAEKGLRESGVRHTILQPDSFMDVWFGMMIERPVFSGEPVTLVADGLRRHSFVAERDVAAFAIAALTTPAAVNATVVIGGPEALSFRDAVRTYEAALGRSIELRSVAPGEPIPGVPQPVWGIAAALESYDSVIPMAATATAYGVELTTAADFARMRVARPISA